MVQNSEIFSTSPKSSILQDPTFKCAQKCSFIKNLLLVLELVVLERFDKNIIKKALKVRATPPPHVA